MKVADRMVHDVVTLEEGQTLREALTTFQRHHIRHIPVVREGKLVGILTDRDVKRATPSPIAGAHMEDYDKVIDSTLISQIMTRNPYTVTPSTPLRDAVKLLHDRKNGALPVVEGDRLVGLITATDMLMDLYRLLPE
jgi:acetoin utilization protein AcuB